MLSYSTPSPTSGLALSTLTLNEWGTIISALIMLSRGEELSEEGHARVAAVYAKVRPLVTAELERLTEAHGL